MSVNQQDIDFYRASLAQAESDIEEQKATGKALKDIMGKVFETHRKRIWEHFGFTVSKDRHDALWDVDWSIYRNGKLIAQEEDKAHYVDSCFLNRTITEFAKTALNYHKKGKEVPVLILHSFTLYNKFDEKTSEFYELGEGTPWLPVMKEKFRYTSLTDNDRIPKERWFSPTEARHGYTGNVREENIIEDIAFIKSLIPRKKKRKLVIVDSNDENDT